MGNGKGGREGGRKLFKYAIFNTYLIIISVSIILSFSTHYQIFQVFQMYPAAFIFQRFYFKKNNEVSQALDVKEPSAFPNFLNKGESSSFRKSDSFSQAFSFFLFCRKTNVNKMYNK